MTLSCLNPSLTPSVISRIPDPVGPSRVRSKYPLSESSRESRGIQHSPDFCSSPAAKNSCWSSPGVQRRPQGLASLDLRFARSYLVSHSANQFDGSFTIKTGGKQP